MILPIVLKFFDNLDFLAFKPKPQRRTLGLLRESTRPRFLLGTITPDITSGALDPRGGLCELKEATLLGTRGGADRWSAHQASTNASRDGMAKNGLDTKPTIGAEASTGTRCRSIRRATRSRMGQPPCLAFTLGLRQSRIVRVRVEAEEHRHLSRTARRGGVGLREPSGGKAVSTPKDPSPREQKSRLRVLRRPNLLSRLARPQRRGLERRVGPRPLLGVGESAAAIDDCGRLEGKIYKPATPLSNKKPSNSPISKTSETASWPQRVGG